MRLHRLALTAFGPYAAAQDIDFDALSASGLFLLEGPTGAGKTTILDAITFALYGGLAGEDAGTDRLRSHFAAPGAEPSVTLEFSVRGVRHRVRRVPEHQRPKKRGDGFTVAAAQVHLERWQDGGWMSRSANKAEAGEAITELVGLNRAQFTQVMLLPQGEFARFLAAGDDDRRVLLTRLFGTGLYDAITNELDRRRAEAVRAGQAAQGAIAAAVSAAGEAAGLGAGERDELLALPRPDRMVRLKELAEELAQTVAVTAAGLEVAAAGLAAARRDDEQARQQAVLMTRLMQALAALREHESGRPARDADAARLDAARRAGPVAPLLDVLASAEAKAAAAAGELRALVPAAAAGEAGDRAVLDALLAGDCPRPEAAADALAAAQRAAARGQAAGQQAAALEHLAGAEAGLAARERELGGLRVQAADLAGQEAALRSAQQALPARIDALEDEVAQARSTATRLAAAAGQQAAAEARLEAASRLATLQPQLAELETVARRAADSHQHLVDEHQRLVQARLDGMAAELAAGLADGDPCPVCGSAAHPAPARAAGSAAGAEEVAAAQRRRETAQALRDQAEADREQLATEAAGQAAIAAGHTVAELGARVTELAGQAAAAQRASQRAAQLEPELAALRAEQDRAGRDLVPAAQAAAAARQQAEQAAEALDQLRAELAAAAQDQPSVAARQQQLRALAAADRELGAALDALAAALGGQREAQQRAGQEARARGFDGLHQARAAVLGPDGQAALDAAVAAWDRQLTALTAAVQAPGLAGLDPGRASAAAQAATAAAAALARAAEAERDVRAAHEAAARDAGRLRQRQADVTAAEQAADRLEEDTAPVIRLAALARGMDGHRRIALTTYVLRHWFGQVVAAANVQLAAMSSDRYELRRTDSGERKRDRAGLTLAVIDRHTGEERSPRSLSGGEMFYTSLALALGLADVVRAEAGGVDLDTLFIDEGFGSLDAQTLDQVMAVIDELRDRGRVVGIVSHVAELKDRVAERLEARRLADGSSAVRVVA